MFCLKGFYNSEGRRANRDVFEGELVDLLKFTPVSMGKFATGFGPYVVNRTEIIRSEKGAGHLLKYHIPLFIAPEVGGTEFRRLDFQVTGNPDDVVVCK
jgi:hypothetical protein